MSEELSRVKSRKKKYKGEEEFDVKSLEKSQSPAHTSDEAPAAISGTLSRTSRYSSAKAKKTVKREVARTDEETATPSRSESYPSERLRLSKMFINSLIVIFVLLLGSLLWWGLEGAPPLRTIW